jgi:carboxymethylenebutenolidase
MCEHDDFDTFASRQAGLSRRDFGALALSAGVIAALPRSASAQDTVGAEVRVRTADGEADAYFVHPATGRHPGVLMWPDIFGLRPAFRSMATRLAESGYAVLVVNPFYRTMKAPTAPDHPDFGDPATRKALLALAGSLSPTTAATDATAFIGYLDASPAVDAGRHTGTLGYCMSGPIALRTAAALPGRVGAVATFHGGGLVTDKPDSPHLLIPRIRAQALIAIAASDDAQEPDSKTTLRDAFAAARLAAEVEVYADTKHGWCPTDAAVYDHDQAEKAWTRLLVLLGRALA